MNGTRAFPSRAAVAAWLEMQAGTVEGKTVEQIIAEAESQGSSRNCRSLGSFKPSGWLKKVLRCLEDHYHFLHSSLVLALLLRGTRGTEAREQVSLDRDRHSSRLSNYSSSCSYIVLMLMLVLTLTLSVV